ncbi:uncharacterized protein LOC134752375 isoform X2 [Cydia strobilella]|uniref:uncharacterized protein LOC134752375 isoform X2 n=1 Tax=Cydia strobilella TaxID=1100964 RepID=UPI003004DEE1
MALVLRNAALQKQVSLLKCIKTRTVVTTANKNNNQAPLSAVSKKRTLRQIFKAKFRFPSFKANLITTPKRDAHTAAAPLYKSVSCFELTDGYRSDDRIQFINDSWLRARSATNFAKPIVNETLPDNASSKFPKDRAGSDILFPTVFESIANAVCPCPCPCGPCGPCCSPCGPCCGNMADCNCGRLLPPPCNTPPKCIQYMQGYYYYPYGTWFCGPYHVNTGAVPVCGPVCPGTACGIAPPNPGLLCKCGPCCCGLLSCSICNPPPFGPGPAGAAPSPWASPNITSSYGVPGISNAQFGGMGSHGSPAMSTQGIFPPCIQESWRQPQPMGQSCLPIPFGVPGSTGQTPMPGGSGFHITFPPVQISPPQTMPTSLSYPTAPQWATQHAPCECSGCVTMRNETETKSPAQVDTPTVMQNIIEPFSKVFPASKPPVNVAEKCKESKKSAKILEDPKVKATFPW